jgi:DNA-binding SARP family transcriptional activator
MLRLKLWLLGPPRVEHNEMTITMERQKALALLVYLAVTGESQRRDTLADLLWPDSSQSSARAGLRRDLSILNKALGGEWLIIDRETVGLPRGSDFWLDLEQFQGRLAECERHGHPVHEVCPACLPLLTEAVSLYRGDFLSGFTLPDCPDFDEWQFFQTESLRQAFASALERLVQAHSTQGAYEAALPLARRWLALDPLHEPAHRCLMQVYAGAGQQAAALRQYQICVQTLEAEFGLPPSAETTALYEQIRLGDVSRVEHLPAQLIAGRFVIQENRHNLPPSQPRSSVATLS